MCSFCFILFSLTISFHLFRFVAFICSVLVSLCVLKHRLSADLIPMSIKYEKYVQPCQTKSMVIQSMLFRRPFVLGSLRLN